MKIRSQTALSSDLAQQSVWNGPWEAHREGHCQQKTWPLSTVAEDRIFVLDCGYTETMLQMQNRVTVCFYLAQTFLLTILTHLFCSSIFVFFHFNLLHLHYLGFVIFSTFHCSLYFFQVPLFHINIDTSVSWHVYPYTLSSYDHSKYLQNIWTIHGRMWFWESFSLSLGLSEGGKKTVLWEKLE